jgi:hypothetical protein
MLPALRAERKIVNKLTRRIIYVGAASVVASLGTANPAAAAPAAKPSCYGQPLEQREIAQPTNGVMTSDLTLVAAGSPCRDINVKAVVDVDGKPTCSTLRVNWATGHKVGKWRKVCTKWVVLAANAPEGAVYVVEAKGRPVTVGVRS